MAKTGFKQILDGLTECASPKKGLGKIVIQTHDYPDHDAVAAAYGLAQLLLRFDFTAEILYRGVIRSHSLKTMVNELHIAILRVPGMAPPELRNQPCIVVDGNPANTNARPVTDFLFGIVDHHPFAGDPPCCPVRDIRSNYGSCASIVAGYWREMKLKPEKTAATALLMGIEMDTDFLSRRVTRADLSALNRLFFTADWEFCARNLKTSLAQKDLAFLDMALEHSQIKGKLFFTLIPADVSQELISILADFFLRLKEIFVAVIIEYEGNERHVSIRSRDPAISAATLMRKALEGIGDGGGHDHMAGGMLDDSCTLDKDALFARFFDAMKDQQE
jgi:nanoRNase/pAp phosphatase (c-di-AMP/oligoRNAs hydrolase)